MSADNKLQEYHCLDMLRSDNRAHKFFSVNMDSDKENSESLNYSKKSQHSWCGKNIRHIPIMSKEGNIIGMLSMRDVVKSLLKDSKKRVKFLNDYISGRYPAWMYFA